MVDAHLESGADIDEDGIDDAFELLNEVSEHVRTGGTLSSVRTSPAIRAVSPKEHSRCQLPVDWHHSAYQCGVLSWRPQSYGTIVGSCGCPVHTGLWVGDCFIYNNSSWRLNYCVGGEVSNVFL